MQTHEHDPTPSPADDITDGPERPTARKAAITLMLVAAGGVALVGVFAALRAEARATPSPVAPPAPRAQVAAVQPSSLKADRSDHDFGDVPIDGGTVETSYALTNTGQAPVTIVATYTSCMCTTATLAFADGSTAGPLGMPGHDLPVTLDREVASGGTVTLTVRFDPAAHGPEATGPVERAIAVHTSDGGSTEVGFTANVVKR